MAFVEHALALLLHFTGFAPLWLVNLGIWLTAALTSVSFAVYIRTAIMMTR